MIMFPWKKIIHGNIFHADKNECVVDNSDQCESLDLKSHCENNPGSYECICEEGYYWDTDGCVGKLPNIYCYVW